VLPVNLYDSSLAIIGNYAYLFGGNGNFITDQILRANINTPVNWEIMAETLPAPLFASQLAIIDGYIYLFGGGHSDGYATDTVVRAPVSDPLTWEDTGFLLPDQLNYSQLAIIDGYIYLYGGQHETLARNVIYKASVATPWLWTDTTAFLPQAMYGHQLCVTDGYVFLVGGLNAAKEPISTIYSASLADPTNFTLNGFLPFPTAFGQMVFVGDRLYYVGGYGTGGSVLRALLKDPLLTFTDRGVQIPGTVTHSQLAIINDRLFLLGGNGSSIIWAAANKVKYKLDKSQVVRYGDITRTQYDAIPDVLDLFNLLGFPPWKTDYGSY
jgi:N-acetylneuraminic acid mutarotase